MSPVDKLQNEVRYLKGEVLTDPQTWSETKVSGSGGGGSYGHASNISVSSKVTTWTSFVIATEEGKEFMVKWPESLSVRKGHFLKAAVFRGNTIAYINEKTDTDGYLINLGLLKYWSEAKAFPTIISYGSLLAFLASLFLPPSLGWVITLTFLIWFPLLIIGAFRKRKIYLDADKRFGKKVLDILQTK